MRVGGRLPFAWRIFVVNAVLLSAAAVALALSPATVSFPIALTEAVVLAAGLVSILVVNLVVIRRAFAPLQRLTALMRRVDLLAPGQRIETSGPVEVRVLGAVFNDMLERLERERRQSGWDALSGQESERKRVARELHDEVGQALTAVMLHVGRVAKKAPPELRGELLEAVETTRDSLEDVRRIARQLRPEALDDLGLAPALNALVATFVDRAGLRVQARIPPELPSLGDDAELVVFRVAQESLTNVARHGGTRVDLSVDLDEPDRLVLRVRDYGPGMNGARPGSGIRGMRERALLIGADLTVGPAPRGGTQVTLALPLEESR